MAKLAKFLQGVAGAAGGAGLNVEEVFSTYVYDGSSSAQTITNNIDLSGEGGLVWIKERSTSGSDHHFSDTERGVSNPLNSASQGGENAYYANNNLGITSFNNNGFTVASGSNFNDSGDTAVAWTFRKAPRFFDIVLYTGNGTAGRTVSHNLGSVPGCIIIKDRVNSTDWNVYHRGNTSAPETDHLRLNTQDATSDDNTIWNDTAPTSTEFTLGSNNEVNGSGKTYVAYLWAHNDGDGEFGPDADADIIKCGSLTDNNGGTVDLGFEPQWVLIRRSDTDSQNTTYGSRASRKNWIICDVTRGMSVGVKVYGLAANSQDAEVTPDDFFIKPTSTGFEHDSLSYDGTGDFIYIAIRRGPMAVPEDADDVFGSLAYTGNGASTREFTVGSAVSDMMLQMCRSSSSYNYPNVSSRLTDKGLTTTSTAAEFALATDFDRMDGVHATGFENTLNQSSETYIMHSWKRAPNYFDAVAYTGNSTAGRTVSHNLGVAPEMMWVKSRSNARGWAVYHKDIGNTKRLVLNSTAAEATNANWNNTTPTDSVFTLGSGTDVNNNNYTYIAYLFASLNGVSKVGSFTGNGTTINVDCGFSSGARFVMTKRTDAGSDWVVWDTARGIVAGNDGYLVLNDVNDENSSYDSIDPYSSGFSLNYDGVATNISGASYIFYAIA